MTTTEVVLALERHRFAEASEEQLQAGVAQVLDRLGVRYEREVALSPEDRIDFLVGRIGIECKIAGGLAAVTRQLHRYAASPVVDSLVLVTTRLQLARVPGQLRGKGINVVATMGGIL